MEFTRAELQMIEDTANERAAKTSISGQSSGWGFAGAAWGDLARKARRMRLGLGEVEEKNEVGTGA